MPRYKIAGKLLARSIIIASSKVSSPLLQSLSPSCGLFVELLEEFLHVFGAGEFGGPSWGGIGKHCGG